MKNEEELSQDVSEGCQQTFLPCKEHLANKVLLLKVLLFHLFFVCFQSDSRARMILMDLAKTKKKGTMFIKFLVSFSVREPWPESGLSCRNRFDFACRSKSGRKRQRRRSKKVNMT